MSNNVNSAIQPVCLLHFAFTIYWFYCSVFTNTYILHCSAFLLMCLFLLTLPYLTLPDLDLPYLTLPYLKTMFERDKDEVGFLWCYCPLFLVSSYSSILVKQIRTLVKQWCHLLVRCRYYSMCVTIVLDWSTFFCLSEPHHQVSGISDLIWKKKSDTKSSELNQRQHI